MSAILYNMKKITTWQAVDGTIFNSIAQCNAYEQSRNLRDYTTRKDWLKEIYARLTVHFYKHYLTKENKDWSSLLREKQDYGYKISHWRRLLENNKDVWDYSKVPANKPLAEFIYNRHLYQSNQSEVVQVYLPERLLTLDLTSKYIADQVKSKVCNIKGFQEITVEYSNYSYCSSDSQVYLFCLTNSNKLIYKPDRSLTNIYSIKAYLKERKLSLEEKVNKLVIDLC